MRRRILLAATAAAALSPVSARSQPKAAKLIGVLMLGAQDDDGPKGRLKAFQQALDVLGWTPEKTVRVEVRWVSSEAASVERHAAELVALKPDVILANGTPSVVSLKKATTLIPIVCALVQDPVGLGLVASLARPGGNITGFTYINPELIGKWELLSDVAPSTKRAGMLFNPAINPQYFNFLRDLGRVAQRAIDTPQTFRCSSRTKFEFAINLKCAKALGLTVSPSLLALADDVIE